PSSQDGRGTGEAVRKQWYLCASQERRWYQKSPDFIRSLRIQVTHPSAWLAAVISYWWVDPFARDAIGWLLTDESPDWLIMQKLLHRARSIEFSRGGAAVPLFCQGLGAAMRACPLHLRTLLSMRRMARGRGPRKVPSGARRGH
ncbi:MAG: hypothetical protein ACKPKO_26320, partial [Candidatus Fonsibacter sp.]